METTSTTPMIQKLVREGHATPYDAALLIQLRGLVRDSRKRVRFREQPFLAIGAFVGLMLLSLIGFKRES